MRFGLERERRGLMLRVWSSDYRQGEIAYFVLALRGLRAEIEFPSDWHEHRRAWIRLCCGFLTIAFSFPCSKTVPDQGQCSGPTYGFYFFDTALVLEWGKTTGRRGDPIKHITMPWAWRHQEHLVLSDPEKHPYRYVLLNGTVQERTATIKVESRRWARPWLPWNRLDRYIDVEFSDEVGERTGSWKGGTLGCGYNMLPNESPLDCLRRMERERKFT